MKRQAHNYLSVGKRCALLLDEIDLKLDKDERKSREKLLKILTEEEGFRRIETNPVREALEQLGKPYRRRALMSDAPDVFNCSSLTSWAYGRCGIRMPRYAISQQKHAPGSTIAPGDLHPGDLIFTDAETGYWIEDEDFRIGHVALAVSEDSVVHAVLDKGVIQESREAFFEQRIFRSIRRVIPKGSDFVVLEAPSLNEVESSEAFLLKILSHL